MVFTTDKQTLDDLNIFGKQGGESIYQLFNRTHTRGGAAVLEEMFRYPLSDQQAIDRRVSVIRYFAQNQIAYPFDAALFDAVEPYLANTDERTKLNKDDNSIGRKLGGLIGKDTQTAIIYNGVEAVIQLIRQASDLVQSLPEEIYGQERQTALDLITSLPAPTSKARLTHEQIAEYDVIYRFRQRDTIHQLLKQLYLLDVYISVAKIASTRNFVFPKAHAKGSKQASLENVYHPLVPNAVPNSLNITADGNLIFLTGANMAGKSTFMKTFGIAFFLAHMGFPVAATKMEFTVLDGIYTTINLPDNLGIGASHFYAEVLRVKKMAQLLAQSKDLLLIFDELFRGTNVKDAYEATIAVTEGFAESKGSIFIISTHIIEAGEPLRQLCSNIRFQYLPTNLHHGKPVYTYTLAEGITADRHGMVIIENEGILEMLSEGLANKMARS